MDNINQVNVAKTESNKEKLLLYVNPLPTISGKDILQEKDQPLALSLSQKIMIVGGGVLILTNITLITLASLKILEILNFL
jgi:hypothetical protein